MARGQIALGAAQLPHTPLVDCTSITGWTVSASSTGAAIETRLDKGNPRGVGCIGTVQPPTDGSLDFRVDCYVSQLGARGIGAWLNFEDPSISNTNTWVFIIYFGTSAGNTAGGFATFAMANNGGGGGCPNEWIYCAAPISGMTYGGGASAARWADATYRISRVLIQKTSYSATGSKFFVGAVDLLGKARPKLILSCDGIYPEQRDVVKPYMDNYGLKGSLHVTWHTLNSAGAMTAANLTTFANAGWSICAHSYKTAVGYDNTTSFPTQADIVTDLKQSQWACRQYGGDGQFLAVPYTNPFANTVSMQRRLEFKNALIEAGVKIARLGSSISGNYSAGIWTQTLNSDGKMGSRFLVYTRQLSDTVTAVAALADIDEAIQTGRTCTHYLHRVGVAGANIFGTAEFNAYINGVAARQRAGLLDVVTWQEWYNQMTTGRTQ